MSTSSGALRITTYETAFGHGRLIWKKGLLVAHCLPVQVSGDTGVSAAINYVDSTTQVHAHSTAQTSIEIHKVTGARIKSLLESYFNGRVIDFEPEKIHLDYSDWSPFETDTAEALWKVPHGGQITYAQLATSAGHPGAHRAVGNFMAKNPFPILLPCHRVVRSDGKPGGYSGGLEWKKKLAEIEGSLPAGVLIK